MKPINPLSQHFEELKKIVPEIYGDITELEKKDRLVTLLKRSLTIIEAVYLQDSALFQSARLMEYTNVVNEMKRLGIPYEANPALMKQASDAVLSAAKKPMLKAGKAKNETSEDRQAAS